MRTEVPDQLQWTLRQVQDEFLRICEQALPPGSFPTTAPPVKILAALSEEIAMSLSAMGVADGVIETFRRATADLQQGTEWAHQAMRAGDLSRSLATWAIDRLARAHRRLIEISTLLTLRLEWISMVGHRRDARGKPNHWQ
jgi:predicted nuclease with RNAse H fold